MSSAKSEVNNLNLESVGRDVLQFFAQYIESQLGIVYSDANYFQLEHRLKDIAVQLKIGSVAELHARAKIGFDSEIKNLLLDLATNNETSFFRDPAVFQAIATVIIPELLNRPNRPSNVRIWSAAASTGQEIYSVGVALQEIKDQLTVPYQLIATDISERVLKRAQTGVYSSLEVQRGLTIAQKQKYFDQEANGDWKVKPEIRRLVTFKKLNLLEHWGDHGSFDLILCRNVLIYQSVANKTKVIEQIERHLNSGGYLFLGAAESMMGLSDKFKQCASNGAVYYKKTT